jgi:hypothetical protein
MVLGGQRPSRGAGLGWERGRGGRFGREGRRELTGARAGERDVGCVFGARGDALVHAHGDGVQVLVVVEDELVYAVVGAATVAVSELRVNCWVQRRARRRVAPLASYHAGDELGITGDDRHCG